MLINESLWIKDIINKLNLPRGAKILNIGSQDSGYLINQSHIKNNVLNPCSDKGYDIINLDIKEGDLIDIVADITKEEIQEKLSKYNFQLVFLSNILEHVTNIKAICDAVNEILPKKSYIIFTGPYKYPKHLDPIDNMFRPKPKELLNFFNTYDIIDSDIIQDYTYKYYLTLNFNFFLFTLFRILTPFYKFNKWRTVVIPKLKYFNKPYEVTCVLLRK
ncbi:MAG: hypothetical protein CMG25_04935 [Candidatus Marinimicrobia bacterium]|nr:hypothetical protein [Candidatus Neomarinimicrobiota bacterium]